MASWEITTAAASLEFDTSNGIYHTCYQIDTNHFINFWQGDSFDGFVQVFTVNTTTWEVTTAAASLEFDTQASDYNACKQIDANHFINFWEGPSSDGFVQVFTVNTTTWEVTTAAASLEFDTQNNSSNSCYQIDTNHFINFWRGGASITDGFVQVFTVNTTTWEVTTAAASLQFDTDSGSRNACYQIDTNHFINFWQGPSGDGFVQVFTVNTTTWAITTAAASLEFETQANDYNACYQIDTNHFINFWQGPSGDGFAQIFTVNTTTWEVTTAAASLEFDTQASLYNSCYPIDTNHFINFWQGPSGDGFAQIFTVNTTTWEVTTAAASLEFNTQDNGYNSCCAIDSNHFINFCSGVSIDGFVQVFTVELPSSGSAIKTKKGLAIASVKTFKGLATASVKTAKGLA